MPIMLLSFCNSWFRSSLLATPTFPSCGRPLRQPRRGEDEAHFRANRQFGRQDPRRNRYKAVVSDNRSLTKEKYESTKNCFGLFSLPVFLGRGRRCCRRAQDHRNLQWCLREAEWLPRRSAGSCFRSRWHLFVRNAEQEENLSAERLHGGGEKRQMHRSNREAAGQLCLQGTNDQPLISAGSSLCCFERVRELPSAQTAPSRTNIHAAIAGFCR